MIPTHDAWERQAIRDAVKEASAKAKAHRERWTVGRASLEANGERHAATEVAWQGFVEADAADVFVETLDLALRRLGGFIMFLE